MVALLGSVLCLLLAQEPQAPPVHFEVKVQRIQTDSILEPGDAVFVGETLWLQLHIDMEQEFFDQQLLPQWRAPLDFQAELSTPWIEPNEDFQTLPTENQNATSLVVDREEGTIERLEGSGDGRVHFQLQQKVLVQGGALDLPAAMLKLAWATEFEEDMIRGRIPVDRQTDTFTTKELRFDILPIPSLDQPLDFYGAVGDFTMQLVELENEIPRKFEIEFRGIGHLKAEQLPRMSQLSDFPFSAQRTELLDDGIKLHLESLSTDPFPSLSWSFFEPASKSFLTRSIGVAVATESNIKPQNRRWTLWIWFTGFVVLLLGAFFWPKTKTESAQEPNRAAFPVKPQVVAPKDLLDDLAALLACSRDDVYADDLSEKLKQTGMEDPLAEACANAARDLFQSRYAERGTPPSKESLNALRKRLQASR